jgi:hypothetical protein
LVREVIVKIWVVTTGSSDVQLTTDEFWNDWYRVPSVKSACYDLRVEKIKPKQLIADSGELYRVAPRILGQVYNAEPEKVWEYLRFPLLDAFKARIGDEGVDRIVLLLTDQGLVFGEGDRDDARCPYWQDTGALLPVFERYFASHFAGVELTVLTLEPQSLEQGLDDWNEVLSLVRSALDEVQVEPEVVYVSHQAGTPAISSAVQFVSLARFRGDVQFLLSNEYRREKTQLIVGRSSYLRGIQLQEVKALLGQHDYVGMQGLLALPEVSLCSPTQKNIKYLLEAGIQWNFAKFQKFKKILKAHELFTQIEFPWWQSGYESAYLAWVRLQQGATVDAMFHSFRAVEGSVGQWAEKHYSQDIERDARKGLQLKKSILEDFPSLKSWFNGSNGLKPKIGLFGKSLFSLLSESRTDWSIDSNIRLFCGAINTQNNDKDIFEWRNNLFHRLEGLQRQELFEVWDATNEDEWIVKVVGCLNFTSGQHKSIEEVSLMVRVHDQLKLEMRSLAQSSG